MTTDLTKMRDRIEAALNDSEFPCARCQHCDRQLNAVMAVVAPELDLAFGPGMYLDIQNVLDAALGTEEADGAGAGIVADVALLAEQKRTADAANENVRAVWSEWRGRLGGAFPPAMVQELDAALNRSTEEPSDAR